MSDFLTRLLARSEGSAEFVRARTPSMFEPAKPATAANASSQFDEVPDTRPEDSDLERDQKIELVPPQDMRRPGTSPLSARSQARVARSAVNRVREDSDTGPASAVKNARIENDVADREADADNPTQSREVRTLRGRLARDTFESPEASPTQSRAVDPAETSDSAEHEVARDVVRAHTQSRRTDTAASVRSGSDLSSLSASSRNAPAASSGKLPVQPIVPAAVGNAIEHPIDRDYSRANNSARHGPGAITEPMVQVSIGRIEIHAVTAEVPTPRKARAASPVMSLDEYLRSRAKGVAR